MVLAGLVLVLAVIGGIMPLPLGTPLAALGLYILVTRSPLARRGLIHLRGRFPRFSAWLKTRARRFPRMFRYFIHKTCPDRFNRHLRRVAQRRAELEAAAAPPTTVTLTLAPGRGEHAAPRLAAE